MQRIIYPFLVFSIFLVACGESPAQKNSSTRAAPPTKKTFKTLPDLPPIYEDFDHLTYLFEQQNDTIYVINFWSTWCAPCIKELPYFEELNQKYLSQKVKVILVSLDFPKQLATKLKPFLKENKLQSEVLVLTDPDANSWVDRVNPAWSGAIPATVIYKGKRNEFYEKAFENLAELEEILSPFL